MAEPSTCVFITTSSRLITKVMSKATNIFKDPANGNQTKGLTYNLEQIDRIEKLKEKLGELQAEHKELREELDGTNNKEDFNIKVYEKETKKHIQQLKKYNELKDVSMKLIQMIADSRQETLKTIMDEMGIDDDK